MKCECDQIGVLHDNMVDYYDPVTELPFVNHQPGECLCTNDVRPFIRNGKRMQLCSCCFRNTDKLVEGG